MCGELRARAPRESTDAGSVYGPEWNWSEMGPGRVEDGSKSGQECRTGGGWVWLGRAVVGSETGTYARHLVSTYES